MKQIITILTLFVTISSFAQWSFKKKHDVFDGDYIVASSYGKGGRYPYSRPMFVINDIGGEYNMYVTGMGSTACDGWYLEIKTDVNDKLYTFGLSEDADGDSVFLKFDNSDVSLQLAYEMLQDFKKGSNAYFRYGTRCSTNQWSMSLSGSSKAINSTKIMDYLDKSINVEKQLNGKVLEDYNKWKSSLTNDIDSILNDYTVTPPYFDGDLNSYIKERLLDEVDSGDNLALYFENNRYNDLFITKITLKDDNGKYRFYKNNKNGWIERKITLLGWKIEKKQ